MNKRDFIKMVNQYKPIFKAKGLILTAYAGKDYYGTYRYNIEVDRMKDDFIILNQFSEFPHELIRILELAKYMAA